jgi:hypothetical protein
MNRALTVLVTACLLATFVMTLPAFGEGAVHEPEACATTITLTVLGDIKDTLKLGFSHEGEDSPVVAETRETAWDFGTVIPQEGALGTSGFSQASTCIEGYGWVIDYQANSHTQCSLELDSAGANDNDITLLRPFFWRKTWRDSDSGDYFRPGPEHWASEVIDPSYGAILTFPCRIKIHMSDGGDHLDANPWSVKAGKYEIKVTSKWSLWPPGDNGTPRDPILTRAGYLCFTVANVINRELSIAIGASPETVPSTPTFTALEVGEDWTGRVYPWILNYQSNSDFDMEVEIHPITLGGDIDAFDIRKYMKHYGWTDSGLETIGRHMYPSAGERYSFKDTILATLERMIGFPNRIELDLSGGNDAVGWDRWKIRAGIYKPTGDTCIRYSSATSMGAINAHTLTIAPDDLQVIVPERQDGYELPERGRFQPEEGIKPDGTGFYQHHLKCYQNHDRNVELAWRWSEGKAGAGEVSWVFFRRSNLEEGTPPDGQVWKGIFKYNSKGKASELGYTVIYEPSWADLPGEKELIITMSHSPTV